MPASPADLWPPGRYLHSACVLFAPTPSSASEGSSKEVLHSPSSDMSAGQHSPQLFVLWGFLKSPKEPVPDAWILDVNSKTWKQVNKRHTKHSNSLMKIEI